MLPSAELIVAIFDVVASFQAGSLTIAVILDPSLLTQ